MSSPNWLDTISDHAVLTKKEVQTWLGVTSPQLLILLKQGFPAPRFGGYKPTTGHQKLPMTCRWRVGDVRAWLEAPDRLGAELAKPIGDPLARKRTFILGDYGQRARNKERVS